MEKEKFDLENFPTSASARKMLSYVSDGFYDESYVGKWLFQVMGLEYEAARELAESLPEQFFPETATWGLRYHEQKWHLPIRENLPHEERRKLIYQKRDYRAPMTPFRMERYLDDATGFETHIADVHDPSEYNFTTSHPNIFKAILIGELELDFVKVEEILNKIKQSHTMYTVEHRQHYKSHIFLYAASVVTEWVYYIIKPRQINRDMESNLCLAAFVTNETVIEEEIMAGRNNTYVEK